MSGLPQEFTVGIVLYDGCDLLDIAGPNEIFAFLGTFYSDIVDLSIVTVADAPRSPSPSYGFTVNAGGVSVTPTFSFQNCPELDLLFVPAAAGGGLEASIKNHALLSS